MSEANKSAGETVHETYQKVCKVTPEAEISGLIWKPGEARTNNLGRWLRNGHRWTEADVAAIITAHWLTLLPTDYSLEYSAGWLVPQAGTDLQRQPTPLLALAAYLETRAQ